LYDPQSTNSELIFSYPLQTMILMSIHPAIGRRFSRELPADIRDDDSISPSGISAVVPTPRQSAGRVAVLIPSNLSPVPARGSSR
jgi:hypothetical protein